MVLVHAKRREGKDETSPSRLFLLGCWMGRRGSGAWWGWSSEDCVVVRVVRFVGWVFESSSCFGLFVVLVPRVLKFRRLSLEVRLLSVVSLARF